MRLPWAELEFYLENGWEMMEMGEKSKREVMIWEGWGKFSSWLCSVKGLKL